MAESKREEFILEAKNFFDFYKKEFGESIRKGNNVIYIDFMKLTEFSSKLSDEILANPEEALRFFELAIEELGLVSNVRIRLHNLPKIHEIKIRDIRSRHLDELIVIEGIIRQASDVRPQVVNAKFECPSCGTVLSVLQIEKKFREPNRCACGRRGGFKLISKEMVDTQRLVIEESPESLSGGEQPKRLNIFVKEDLVEPKMEEKTTPGSRIKAIGILKEVPVPLHTGGLSTRFELAVEADNLIPLEETFEELNINEEEENQIIALSKDPKIFDKLAKSIAPSIWGHEEIKKSIVLQLFGGVQKIHLDRQKTRGDIHILLIGDPGVAKSATLTFISSIAPKGRYVVGKSASLDYNEPLLIRKNGKQKFIKIGQFVDRYYNEEISGFVPCDEDIEALSCNLKTLNLEWKPIKAVFRHKSNEKLLSFSLETGRKIKVTKEHSIFCLENGEIKCKPSQQLKEGDFIVIPKQIPTNNFELPEEIAKFLGYFIAEGHLYNRNGSYKIQFTLNKNETDIASEINYISEKFFNKEAKISKHGENSIRLTIYGKEPYLKICSLIGSIAHKKAVEKGVPEIIINSNPNARQAFFNSYIEGDAGVTKSEKLMSELLYLKLQDNIIASCLERKLNRTAFLENGRKIIEKGNRFDLLSPHSNKKFQNLRLNFPLDCLPNNLKLFFKRKFKQSYSRINIKKIDNNLLLERILRVYKEERINGKKIRELFGENSLDYFSIHSDIFQKKKLGREIELSLTENGKEMCKSLLNLRRLLESDVAFVKIKKIKEESSTSDFVYDVSTPENENFVAGFGGILCHNSGAGLTATVVRDEYLRGWSLEAGAMVLANHGLVAIDELEKMDPTERSAMHEAMEQQTITISKANVQACYSEDTEVLTEKGWKKYNEVGNLKIAQYNLLDNTIKFLYHKGLHIYNYNGIMYNFKDRRNNISVTPNHTMFIKREKQNRFEKINAEDIKSYRFKIKNSAEFLGEETKSFTLPAIKHKQNRSHIKYTHQHKDKKIPMNLWLEFLGYYITEGGIETAPTIRIVQKKGEKAKKIENCLKKLTNLLGCSLSKIDCGKYIRFKITQTQIYNFLKDYGNKCYFKKLGLNFSLLSKKQLKILYNSMMLGDGSSDGKYFSCTSKELSDELQIIAHLIGKSASQNIHYKEGTRGKRKTAYRVSLSNRTEPLIKRNSVKKMDYTGKVFCFSTHTGFFVTRRNGKIAIQGNTLRSETSVLAAANPKFGRFDPYQPIAQQIDLPPTLINRFDVIFTLRDIPNRETDEKIATHVLDYQQQEGKDMTISRELFRKYIAYAKQRFKPELSEEAMTEIKKFYVDLRNKPVSSDSALRPIPISARQLQALIRMSEASAKSKLSKKVTKKDAKIAIDIMKHCLMQVGYDYESKTFDIDKISSKFTFSQRDKIFTVRDIITELETKVGKMIPIEEIEKELVEKMNKNDIEDAINKLKINGVIFEPKKGYIQKTSD